MVDTPKFSISSPSDTLQCLNDLKLAVESLLGQGQSAARQDFRAVLVKDISVENWIAPLLINSWTASDSSRPVGYYKDPFGIVRIRGFVSGGSSVSACMFNLPEGYRPASPQYFTVWSNSAACRLCVYESGNILIVSGGSTSGCDLDGISFRAEQ